MLARGLSDPITRPIRKLVASVGPDLAAAAVLGHKSGLVDLVVLTTIPLFLHMTVSQPLLLRDVAIDRPYSSKSLIIALRTGNACSQTELSRRPSC